MKILLDECVPGPLAKWLPSHDVQTTQQMGWKSKKNGELLALAAGDFDLFITADQNLSYQQNLTNRTIAVLLLPTNRLPNLTRHKDKIVNAVQSIKSGEFVDLDFSA